MDRRLNKLTSSDKKRKSILVKRIPIIDAVLLKVTGGRAKITINSAENLILEMSDKDIIFIEKGQSISFSLKKDNCYDKVQVIEIKEELLRSIFPIITHLSPNGGRESLSKRESCFLAENKPHAEDVFSMLSTGRMNSYDADYVYSVFYLLSLFCSQTGFIQSLERMMRHNYSEKLYRMMIDDINTPWTLEICAQKLHTSVSTLKRKLALEETSFREVYLDARMNTSLTLLRTTRLQIAEIAEKSGLKSGSSFSTTFKRYFSTTPKKAAQSIS